MFDFKDLSDQDQKRLRRINHMTSADTALQILRSQRIWSKDNDQMANFSLNRNPIDRLDKPREISLGFHFDGPIKLISTENPPSGLVPDVLYIYISKWPWVPKLEDAEFWAARLVPGSQKHLLCDRAFFVEEFVQKSKTDPRTRLIANDIQAAVKLKPRICVPKNKIEQDEIRNRYPAIKYSLRKLIKSWFDIKLTAQFKQPHN